MKLDEFGKGRRDSNANIGSPWDDSKRMSKKKELHHELSHEDPNNYGVSFKGSGRFWKIFKSKKKAESIAANLRKKGREATVSPTSAPVTESQNTKGQFYSNRAKAKKADSYDSSAKHGDPKPVAPKKKKKAVDEETEHQKNAKCKLCFDSGVANWPGRGEMNCSACDYWEKKDNAGHKKKKGVEEAERISRDPKVRKTGGKPSAVHADKKKKDKAGYKKHKGVEEGASTMWEVSLDVGPHQSISLKVKASSEDEAKLKAKAQAKKQNYAHPMVNFARAAKKGVEEAERISRDPKDIARFKSKAKTWKEKEAAQRDDPRSQAQREKASKKMGLTWTPKDSKFIGQRVKGILGSKYDGMVGLVSKAFTNNYNGKIYHVIKLNNNLPLDDEEITSLGLRGWDVEEKHVEEDTGFNDDTFFNSGEVDIDIDDNDGWGDDKATDLAIMAIKDVPALYMKKGDNIMLTPMDERGDKYKTESGMIIDWDVIGHAFHSNAIEFDQDVMSHGDDWMIDAMDLGEASSPGKRVVITKGRHKGKTGSIGEVHTKNLRGGEKEYIVDLDDSPGEENIRVNKSMFKMHKSIDESPLRGTGADFIEMSKIALSDFIDKHPDDARVKELLRIIGKDVVDDKEHNKMTMQSTVTESGDGECPECYGDGVDQDGDECEICSGTGEMSNSDEFCDTCRGSGCDACAPRKTLAKPLSKPSYNPRQARQGRMNTTQRSHAKRSKPANFGGNDANYR